MAVLQTVRDLVYVVRDRDVPFLAAAIAHYTLASLVPLLLLAVALAALVGSQEAIESFISNRLGPILSDSGQQLVTAALTSTEGAAGAGIASILLAFWSGSKVFRGLDIAFNRIYDVESEPTLPEQLLDAAVVIGLLAVSVATMVALGVIVSVVDIPIPFPTLVGTVILLLALSAGLLPIYYVLTPVDPDIEDVLPGTLLAAVGLVALQVAFVYYTRFAGQYEALGLLGALLLFVIWLYFGGIIVLLGGALNYVTRYSPTVSSDEEISA
jgi:membrane protein